MARPNLKFGRAFTSLTSCLSLLTSLAGLTGTAAFPAFAGDKEILEEGLEDANRCLDAMAALNNPNVALCHPAKGEKIQILPVPGQYYYNYPSCKPSKSPLFSSDSVLEITVHGYKYNGAKPANGRRLANQIENPISIDYTLDGKKQTLKAGSETRGKSRQRHCSFKPLRIMLDEKEDRSGTLIEHIKDDELKLTVHCTYTSGKIKDHPADNQNVINEYFQYKALKAAGYIVPDARLAKVTYLDNNGNFVTEGYGFFIEPKKDLAHRCEAKHIKAEDHQALAQMRTMDKTNYVPFLFAEEMIKGWDWIPSAAHNTIPLTKDGKIVALAPYDFNDTLLVAARGPMERNAVPGTENVEAWIRKIQSGPYDRNGAYLNNLSPKERAHWKKALEAEARRVLARKDEVMKALEASPVENKGKFKGHYERFFAILEKYLAGKGH
jgi:hypothetical protein